MIDQFLSTWQAQGKSPSTLKLYRTVLWAFAGWLDVDDLDAAPFTSVMMEPYMEQLFRATWAYATTGLWLASAWWQRMNR